MKKATHVLSPTVGPRSPVYGAVIGSLIEEDAILSLNDTSSTSSADGDDDDDDDESNNDEEDDQSQSKSSISGNVAAFQPQDDSQNDNISEDTPLIRVLTNSSVFTGGSEVVSDGEILRTAQDVNASLSWSKKPSVSMMSLAVFLFLFATSFSSASEVQLLIDSICYSMNKGRTNKMACDSAAVQESNARVQTWLNLTSIISIMVSSELGRLSDIYGRKPVLLYTFLCSFASKVVTLFVFTPSLFSPGMLLAAQAIGSLGGDMPMILGIADSYVIDVVDKSERMDSIGKIMAYISFGSGLGPLASSPVNIKPRNTLKVSIFMQGIVLILCWVFLNESRPARLRRRSRRKSMNKVNETSDSWAKKLGLDSMLQSFKSLKMLWITRRLPNGKIDIVARVNTILLVIINVLVMFVGMACGMPAVLYGLATFHWTPNIMSMFLGIVMLFRTFALLFINPQLHSLLQRHIKESAHGLDHIDLFYLFFAICNDIAGQLTAITAKNTGQFLGISIFTACSSFLTPTLHSCLVKYNQNESKNGELFGALAFILNIITLFGPMIGLAIYSATLEFRPTLIFVICAIINSVAFVVISFLRVQKDV